MLRNALAILVIAVSVSAARAADLPTGTWAVNVDGNKGDFTVKEVKDGKFTGVLLGTDVSGTWDGKTISFQSGKDIYEAHLVREPADAGKVKYTLTGMRSQQVFNPNRAGGGNPIHVAKVGWYAQITADAPVIKGEIKAEVRGVLVYDEAGSKAHVSVKREGAAEIRVWFNPTEGEWKKLQNVFGELNGKEVLVTGQLAQSMSKDLFPIRGMYFLGKFDIKLANAPK